LWLRLPNDLGRRFRTWRSLATMREMSGSMGVVERGGLEAGAEGGAWKSY
jgi:hypothetical protein